MQIAFFKTPGLESGNQLLHVEGVRGKLPKYLVRKIKEQHFLSSQKVFVFDLVFVGKRSKRGTRNDFLSLSFSMIEKNYLSGNIVESQKYCVLDL